MAETSAHPYELARFALASAVAAISAASFLFIVTVQPGSAQFVVAFDDLAEACAAFIAAAFCAWAATRSASQLRRGWALFAASAAAWGTGEVIWSVYEVGLGVAVPDPSLADIGFLAAVPLAIAGVLSFWSLPRGTAGGWRVWLDALIIVVSLTFTGWALGLKDVYLASGTSIAERAFELAYPLGDIFIGTALILAIRRATRLQQVPLILLLGGLAAAAISDSAFAYLNASDAYTNATLFVDTGWVVGYLMIALAALWPSGQGADAVERGSIDIWQLALPWFAVLIAAASAVVIVLRGERTDEFMTVLAATLGVLLMISQILAHKDSRSMLIRSQQSEFRLATILAQAPIGIARADTSFNIIDANPALGVLFRETPRGMIGTTIAKYLPVEVQAPVFEKLGELVSGAAETVGAESHMVRADGSSLWVHWTSTAIRQTTGGEVDSFLTMLEDVTERHQAEESAKANLAVLESLNQIKTTFLQSVSHEFKTALIGIEGFSELMLDGSLGTEEIAASATEIHTSATRLDQMINEMLELDEVVGRRTTMRMGPVDLNGLIKNEAKELRYEMDGVDLVTDLDPSLATVLGDAARLSQAMRTLLHNALKHSPDGGQILVTSRLSEWEAEVSVRDQGVGARADFDNPVLDKDDLYANNPIRRVIGTGFGLGIAREIIHLHGGRLWVDRLEGKGSEFHFTVPVANAPPVQNLEAA